LFAAAAPVDTDSFDAFFVVAPAGAFGAEHRQLDTAVDYIWNRNAACHDHRNVAPPNAAGHDNGCSACRN
jgi:hypothetical protein